MTRDSLQACIDQSDIERSLACLPIFLSGCKTLLIVVGPTCAGAACSPQATPYLYPTCAHPYPLSRAHAVDPSGTASVSGA